jgi:hypothetical protein
MNIASLAAFLDALDSLPVLTTAQRAAEVAAALLSAKHPGSRNQLSVQVARALVAPVRPGTPTPIAAAAQFPAAQPVGNSPRPTQPLRLEVLTQDGRPVVPARWWMALAPHLSKLARRWRVT